MPKYDNYCKHGTFVGHPFGPDYMCGWCESGIEPPTWEELGSFNVADVTASEILVTTLEDQAREGRTLGYGLRLRRTGETSWVIEAEIYKR